MKKLCIFLFVALLAVWLAGCGDNASSASSGVATDRPAASETPAISTAEPAAEPTTPSSNVEEPLPPLGEQEVMPAEFDEVTVQWKNDDGYLFEGTFAVSDWIKYDDEALLSATWKSVAGDRPFPDFSSKMPFNEEMTLPQCKYYDHLTDTIVYAVGSYEINNITPDFSITASQPTKTTLRLYGGTLFSLLALYHDDTGAKIYDIDATGIMKIEDEVFTDLGAGGGFGGGLGIPINMSSDSTGVRPFVIAISISGVTPNQPSPLPDITRIATEIRFYHQGYDWDTKMDNYIFTQNITWE